MKRKDSVSVCGCFVLQAEDGIRDLVRSRGLGDVYKRQGDDPRLGAAGEGIATAIRGDARSRASAQAARGQITGSPHVDRHLGRCLLYTSDAADERSSVDLGGRRIIKKKKYERVNGRHR